MIYQISAVYVGHREGLDAKQQCTLKLSVTNASYTVAWQAGKRNSEYTWKARHMSGGVEKRVIMQDFSCYGFNYSIIIKLRLY